MTQPKFNRSLSLEMLNATLSALQAQQQAIGNAISLIKEQAEAQVQQARDEEAAIAQGLEKAARAAKKAAKTTPAPGELPAENALD